MIRTIMTVNLWHWPHSTSRLDCCFASAGGPSSNDDGGRWRLDADPLAERYLGKRVRIEGIRFGFDLLDVSRVAPLAD